MKNQEFNPRYYSKTPHFWDGVDSIFNLYHAKEYKIRYSLREDYNDIKSDFEGVGHDLTKAINDFKRQHNLK